MPDKPLPIGSSRPIGGSTAGVDAEPLAATPPDSHVTHLPKKRVRQQRPGPAAGDTVSNAERQKDANKRQFIAAVAGLRLKKGLAIPDLARAMGQQSPAPLYRFFSGNGAVGPRLVAQLAVALGNEEVVTAYKAWMPTKVQQVHEMLRRPSIQLSPNARMFKSWADIRARESELTESLSPATNFKWTATLICLSEPDLFYSDHLRAAVSRNVARGAQYRYVLDRSLANELHFSGERARLEWLKMRFEEGIGDVAPAGCIEVYFADVLGAWSPLSKAAPIAEVLTFENSKLPTEAYLIFSKDILSLEEECAVRLEKIAGMKLGANAGDICRENEPVFRIPTKAKPGGM